MNPRTYGASVLRRSGSSFGPAVHLVPRARRWALEAIYAACREMDDVADGAGTEKARRMELASWSEELRAAAGGIVPAGARPAVVAVHEAAREFGVDLRHFQDLLDGLKGDVKVIRVRTASALMEYCDRVAGAVGLLCLPVFGVREKAGAPYGIALGRGLQLTNVLRDLASDLRRDRIYVPSEERTAFGIPNGSWERGDPGAGFDDLLAFQVLRARAYLRRAAEIRDRLPTTDRRALRPAEAMRRAYEPVLSAVERAGRSLLVRRPAVSRWRRVLLASGAMLGR